LGAKHTPKRLRAHRLVAATAISSLGDGLALVAFPLFAVQLTTHPVLIAGIAIAASLPWLLVSLPAGAIVDRVERRRLVLVVELCRAVLIALVALGAATSRLSIADLYIAVFLVATGETLVSAAARAIVPVIAKEDRIVAVNGQVMAAETVGVQFAGPAIGGVVFSVASALPFLGDALSYVASGFLLRSAIPPNAAEPRSSTGIVADVRSGLRWFAASPPLRILAVVVTSFAFCQAMVLAVLVLYATRILGLGGTGYGLFLGIAAVGDLAASLFANRVYAFLGPFFTVLAAGTAAGIGYVILSSTSDRYVAVAALALEAAGTSLGNVATLSLRHRIIPTARFGLVNNAFRMSVVGVVTIGSVVGGTLTAALGTRSTFVIAGVFQLAVLTVMTPPLRVACRRIAQLRPA